LSATRVAQASTWWLRRSRTRARPGRSHRLSPATLDPSRQDLQLPLPTRDRLGATSEEVKSANKRVRNRRGEQQRQHSAPFLYPVPRSWEVGGDDGNQDDSCSETEALDDAADCFRSLNDGEAMRPWTPTMTSAPVGRRQHWQRLCHSPRTMPRSEGLPKAQGHESSHQPGIGSRACRRSRPKLARESPLRKPANPDVTSQAKLLTRLVDPVAFVIDSTTSRTASHYEDPPRRKGLSNERR